MRSLLPTPDTFLDPQTGAPRLGSYRGSLPPIDLARLMPRRIDRLFKHKQWVYLAIASDQLYMAVAVVQLGYIAKVFAYAFDSATKQLLSQTSALCLPFGVSINNKTGEGSYLRARFPGGAVRLEQPVGENAAMLTVELQGLRVFACLDTAPAPSAISAIARIQDGIVNATEKRVLLAVKGEAFLGGRHVSLDGALAGWDYTNGLLARRTAWRWGFALGHDSSGKRIAFNLVEGFVGADECAVWLDDQLFPLEEARFAFDRRDPLGPWEVRTVDGAVDLRFFPAALHSDQTNMGLVRSNFIQPIGFFSGSIRPPTGPVIQLNDILGVTEDQDVLW